MSEPQVSGSNWQEIPDKDVRHIWQCEHDDCDEQSCVSVSPDYYQESGTPLCKTCSEDMQYIRTEIRRKV